MADKRIGHLITHFVTEFAGGRGQHGFLARACSGSCFKGGLLWIVVGVMRFVYTNCPGVICESACLECANFLGSWMVIFCF